MMDTLEVLGRMLILRRIAAAYISTSQAQAEMNPPVAHLYAFFAHMFAGFLNLDLIKMGALLCHKSSSEGRPLRVK